MAEVVDAGEEVVADVVAIRKVGCACAVDMREGGVAQPVLPRRVGEDNLGCAVVDGERRQGAEAGGVHQRGLGVALVALAPAAAGHLDLGPVVHLAAGLVSVEAGVQPAPHEAARL